MKSETNHDRIFTVPFWVALIVWGFGVAAASAGHSWGAFGLGAGGAMWFDDWHQHIRELKDRLEARLHDLKTQPRPWEES